MSALYLKQSVVVKVVVTEKFKEEYKAELQRQISTAESRAKELRSSLSRVVIESAGISNASYVETLKSRIEEERMLQESVAAELRERLKDVDKLEVNSIFPYTVLEGLTEVKEGDNLFRKISSQEILLKDDIVIGIKSD